MKFTLTLLLLALLTFTLVTMFSHAQSAASFFLYIVLLWALSPLLYLLLQVRSAPQAPAMTTTTMCVVAACVSLYFIISAWLSPASTESNLAWLFGPLLQWALMIVAAMGAALISMRIRRYRQSTR